MITALIAAVAAFAVTADCAAAPQSATATRAELTTWLERLRVSGVDVAAPQPWRYSFSASVAVRLETFSLELVRLEYAIETLRPRAPEGAELLVTRVELLTPAALERRSRELESLARKHGVRYVGVDVAAGVTR